MNISNDWLCTSGLITCFYVFYLVYNRRRLQIFKARFLTNEFPCHNTAVNKGPKRNAAASLGKRRKPQKSMQQLRNPDDWIRTHNKQLYNQNKQEGKEKNRLALFLTVFWCRSFGKKQKQWLPGDRCLILPEVGHQCSILLNFKHPFLSMWIPGL